MHQGLLVGLPESGKTTFVAALWHVIASQEVEGALALEILDAPTDHLNELRGRWLRFEETFRTSSSAEKIATIKIRARDGNLTTEIVIPDLAGESIQRGLIERRWAASFAELVRGSTGVLLFVHPEKLSESWPIADAIEIAGEDERSYTSASTSEESAASDWSPDAIETQVMLVDLLQLLCGHIKKERFRLAVIVSAWDLVLSKELPIEWLAKELPLLNQFLINAHCRLDFRVYGVSAQGGQLPDDVDRLTAYSNTSDRIQVVLDGLPSHDITAPIRWALNVDCE